MMESNDVQIVAPKPTWFNNYYFRSKLEAKWAVFFTHLKIKWIYEPEAFVCDDGSQYTPDFFLPDVYLRDIKGVYLEIKAAHNIDEAYNNRITSSMNGGNLVIFYGDPVEAILDKNTNNNLQIQPFWDNYMVFMFCDSCRTAKIEFDEGNYYYCPKCDERLSHIDPEVSNAAEFARNFRFQFYDPRNK